MKINESGDIKSKLCFLYLVHMPVAMSVQRSRHVSRLFRAVVDIAVVLGQKVDVVEDVARVVGLFTRLRVADVHQHRSVEPGRLSLDKKQQERRQWNRTSWEYLFM